MWPHVLILLRTVPTKWEPNIQMDEPLGSFYSNPHSVFLFFPLGPKITLNRCEAEYCVSLPWEGSTVHWLLILGWGALAKLLDLVGSFAQTLLPGVNPVR